MFDLPPRPSGGALRDLLRRPEFRRTPWCSRPTSPTLVGMYEVRLSVPDFCDCVDTAAERMRQSARRSLNHCTVRTRPLFVRLRDDICGCCSELAVARWIGVEWSRSVGTFHAADVGEDIQVRTTHRDDGRLILRERDFPGHWYVLVTGTPPVMSLRGYVLGSDAMTPEWCCNPHDYGGAWFVPQAALLPVPPDGVVPPCLRQVQGHDQRASLRVR